MTLLVRSGLWHELERADIAGWSLGTGYSSLIGCWAANVRGTRTNGAVRDLLEPPCRRVDRPRGTGFTRTGVSPRAIAYE
jgi:hypothetical protein